MRKMLLLLWLALGAWRPVSAQPNTLDLPQCYDLAVRRSETVAISEEAIVQAAARFTRVLGDILPKLAVNATEFLQDPADQALNAGTPIGSTFTQLSRPEVNVAASLPLFRGFKEVNGLKTARADQTLQRRRKANVERLLYLDVAVAFYTVLRLEEEIATTHNILEVGRNQTAELRERIELGKNRQSELLAQETEVALLEGELVRQETQRRIAYEMLSFLTGLDPHPPIRDANSGSEPTGELDAFLVQVGNRPDVQAAEQAVQVAEGEVKIVKGDYLPALDVTAKYYPYRVGFQSEIHWDTLFTLKVPIFNLSTTGLVRESTSKMRQAAYAAEQNRRFATTEIKKAYEAYAASRLQLQKFQTAVGKAQQSYALQRQDFRLGLINQLDLLESQRILLNAMRQRDASRVQALLDRITLKITAGELPAGDAS